MIRHKHADLIHAWADGAEIQIRSRYTNYEWEDNVTPVWSEDPIYEYRIKPEEKKPVVRWLWAYQDSGSKRWRTTDLFGEKEAPAHWVKLEWSRTEFPE